jgi:hypothetical protein
MIFDRMARWTDDLTFDFAPAEILYHLSFIIINYIKLCIAPKYLIEPECVGWMRWSDLVCEGIV